MMDLLNNTWVISDTHFGHKNIIRFCRSNKFEFSDDGLEEMNKHLIHKWNKYIQPKDTVIHLGDVAFKMPMEKCQSIIDRLNGRKVLVRGNHDRGVKAMYDMGFDVVLEQMVMYIHGYNVLFSHKPQSVLPSGIDCVFHGHIHNSKHEDLINAQEDPNVLDDSFNINLSVEVLNYRPITLAEAFSIFKKK